MPAPTTAEELVLVLADNTPVAEEHKQEEQTVSPQALQNTPPLTPSHPRVLRNVSGADPDLVQQLRACVAVSAERPASCGGLAVVQELSAPMYTFQLPRWLSDGDSNLPKEFKNFVLSELLDEEVLRRLEAARVLNWDTVSTRLLPLRTSEDGDCLLHGVSLGMWGVSDRENVLRTLLADSIGQPGTSSSQASRLFHDAWRQELDRDAEQDGFGASMTSAQYQSEWTEIQTIAATKGRPLEPIHIFVLAHVLRRPILVYADRMVYGSDGEALSPCRIGGIYLPILWGDPNKTFRAPLALSYGNGHFCALVTVEGTGASGTNAMLLPLTYSTGELLPIHFLPAKFAGSGDAQCVFLLYEWLDCEDADDKRGGWSLKARQATGPRPEFYQRLLQKYFDASYSRFSAATQHAADGAPVPPSTWGSKKPSEHVNIVVVGNDMPAWAADYNSPEAIERDRQLAEDIMRAEMSQAERDSERLAKKSPGSHWVWGLIPGS
eukprot:jgi/Chlat1/272/Chrsp1S03053